MPPGDAGAGAAALAGIVESLRQVIAAIGQLIATISATQGCPAPSAPADTTGSQLPATTPQPAVPPTTSTTAAAVQPATATTASPLPTTPLATSTTPTAVGPLPLGQDVPIGSNLTSMLDPQA